MILFQSVLPMRCMYTYTATNFQGFNTLIRNVSARNKCHFVDWFPAFLNYHGNDINPLLYRDSVHLNRTGYNVLHSLIIDLMSNHYALYANNYSR